MPWSEEAEKRGCYCGLWDKKPKILAERGLTPGFCGRCDVCDAPGHMRHYPGPVPATGSWCDRHYAEEKERAAERFATDACAPSSQKVGFLTILRDHRDMQDLEDFSEENRDLVAELRDPDWRMRLLTLKAGTIEVDDEVAEEMLRLLLEDPNEEVRAQVPIALGPTLELCWDELVDGRLPNPGDYNLNPLTQEGYDGLTETLRRVYLDESNPLLVRRRVLEGAVRSPQPWHEEAVAAAFRSEEMPWRVTAVFCMGFVPGFDDQIVEAFDSGLAPLRYQAIRAAGSREVERRGRPILAIAADPDAELDERLAAIESLPVLSPPGTFEILDDLGADPEEAVVEAADEALEEHSMLALTEADSDDDWDDP